MQIKEPFGLYRCCNNHDLLRHLRHVSGFCEEFFTSYVKYAARLAAANGGRRAEAANGMSGMTRMFGGVPPHLAALRPESGKQGRATATSLRTRRRVAHHLYRFYVQHAAMERDAAMSKAEDVLSKYKG